MLTEQQEILEIVKFLKDNAPTKKEMYQCIAESEARTNKRIDELDIKFTESKSEIITHIDSFIQLHQKLDQELTALRGKYDQLEAVIQKIVKHLQLDVSTL